MSPTPRPARPARPPSTPSSAAPKPASAPWRIWWADLRATCNEALFTPIFDPLQNPLPQRVRAVGLLTAVGHPVFYLLWTAWIPQPYESLWQRLAVAGLGLVLALTPALWRRPQTAVAKVFTYLILWITLPFFTTWMYLCNLPSPVWFASAAAMLLIYLQLIDWRLALLGLLTGLPAAWLLFQGFGPVTAPMPDEVIDAQLLVFAFCGVTGLTLGMTSANLRREQLKQALDTMGIMAHELRTPLVTMSLIGEALRHEAHHGSAVRQEQVGQLANRLLALVHVMHRQIDTQIMNARLLRLPKSSESVTASALLLEAVAGHPYRRPGEKDCVELRVHQDFTFHTVRTLFLQAVDNLLRNALQALASQPEPPRPGDLLIEIERIDARRGRIRIADRGPGIPPHLLACLFQPFVSGQHAGSHGLGLAFCQRVMHRSGGRLRAESIPGEGAAFIIELPLAPPARRVPTAPPLAKQRAA